MSNSIVKEHLSPKLKLLDIFETGRDRWEEKCKEAKAQFKASKTNVRRLIKQRDLWKNVATGNGVRHYDLQLYRTMKKL